MTDQEMMQEFEGLRKLIGDEGTEILTDAESFSASAKECLTQGTYRKMRMVFGEDVFQEILGDMLQKDGVKDNTEREELRHKNMLLRGSYGELAM